MRGIRKLTMSALFLSHPFCAWTSSKILSSSILFLPPIAKKTIKNEDGARQISMITTAAKLFSYHNTMVSLTESPTLSFCGNRHFNQTSAINGSMKRHSDNCINRTQVLSIPCHGGKSSLVPDMHMGPTKPSEQWQNPVSVSILGA